MSTEREMQEKNDQLTWLHLVYKQTKRYLQQAWQYQNKDETNFQRIYQYLELIAGLHFEVCYQDWIFYKK